MKKFLLIAGLFGWMYFVSCTNEPIDNTPAPPPRSDYRYDAVQPSSDTSNKLPGDALVTLGVFKLSAGLLYKYKCGDDTLYVIEGHGSSYPVSLQVK